MVKLAFKIYRNFMQDLFRRILGGRQ